MKTVEQRVKESANILYQLRAHSMDDDPGVKQLRDDMLNFVRTGEEQTGTGTLSNGQDLYWHFSNSFVSHVHVMKPKPKKE
jgi:hypothetical protein